MNLETASFLLLLEIIVAFVVVEILSSDLVITRSEMKRNRLLRKLHNAMDAK